MNIFTEREVIYNLKYIYIHFLNGTLKRNINIYFILLVSF